MKSLGLVNKSALRSLLVGSASERKKVAGDQRGTVRKLDESQESIRSRCVNERLQEVERDLQEGDDALRRLPPERSNRCVAFQLIIQRSNRLQQFRTDLRRKRAGHIGLADLAIWRAGHIGLADLVHDAAVRPPTDVLAPQLTYGRTGIGGSSSGAGSPFPQFEAVFLPLRRRILTELDADTEDLLLAPPPALLAPAGRSSPSQADISSALRQGLTIIAQGLRDRALGADRAAVGAMVHPYLGADRGDMVHPYLPRIRGTGGPPSVAPLGEGVGVGGRGAPSAHSDRASPPATNVVLVERGRQLLQEILDGEEHSPDHIGRERQTVGGNERQEFTGGTRALMLSQQFINIPTPFVDNVVVNERGRDELVMGGRDREDYERSLAERGRELVRQEQRRWGGGAGFREMSVARDNGEGS